MSQENSGATSLASSLEKKDPSTVRTRSVTGSTHAQPWWKLGGKDRIFVTVDGDTSDRPDRTDSNDILGNNEFGNVYSKADTADLYAPIDSYEGKHRYDPSYTWSEAEEKQLVRRLDWKICSFACLMFFALQLDRGNITQALSDNLLKDLKLTTNDYNNGQTIFFCSFLFAELPSQLISKRLGPENWIPVQMVAWSIVALSQIALSGRISFYICRALLGLIEGGFIPDVILYLSYFYKNRELPVRLSFFWSAYVLTNIISAFLACGILHLRGRNGLEGWRWLFAIEGTLTAVIGIISWLYLPSSPTQTKRHGIKGALRPKEGWFTEHEEKIMVNRILREDPGKATMHNRQALSPKLFWQSLTDYHMWPIYLIGLTWLIPMTPPTAYLTLTLRGLGFNTFNTNLLTIPANVLYIIQLLFWTWPSEKINQRLLMGLISQIWVFPLLIALEVLPAKFPGSQWSKFAISSLIVGYPYAHAVLVVLTSRNSGSVRTRTVGSSLYNMTVQMSNIISSQIYRDNDKPLYGKGNKVLLGVLAYNVVLFIASKAYYVWVNKRRDAVWNGMTREERIHYLETTTDEGKKRLDFRFAS